MRTPDWINLFIFSFFLILAWRKPLRRQQRLAATAIGGIGIILILTVSLAQGVFPSTLVSAIRDWLPGLLMLMVYWQAGQFSAKPAEKLERHLLTLDEKLLGTLARSHYNPWGRKWLEAYLEFAYLFCYPLIPAGILVLYLTGMRHQVDEYWMNVLPATYPCYVLLPFLQTLPPRLLPGDPFVRESAAGIRRLNLRVLDRASIQLNTFPSAHVASTMAASLALLRLIPIMGLVFLWVSISLGIGAVLGRYHYAADAILAAMIAGLVFAANGL
jgi:membrane-associated phospholipid phosphatase